MAETLYWDKEAQTIPPKELKARQFEMIQHQLEYVYNHSPFYHDLYDRHGVKPEQIKSWEDFEQRIPVFRKDDLREYQKKTGDPFSGLACVPRSHLVAVWTSSGTTGMPTLGAYTREDLQVAIDYLSRSYWDAGYRPGMRAMAININWHWLMPITLGVIRRLQMRPIFFDFGHAMMADRFAKWLHDYKPDVIPSITTELAAVLIPQALRKAGYPPKDVLGSVKYISTMGEALTDTARQNIVEDWGGVTVRDGAGCGESYCWMFEGSCDHPGAHYWGDIGYLEVLDPDTGQKAGDPVGRGELVATNLQVKGVPYIRFATEDYVEVIDEACDHFTHPYGRILGRTVWRVKVKGKDILPYDVEKILQRYPETRKAEFFLEKRAPDHDKLYLSIAYDPELTHDPDELRKRLQVQFQREIQVDSEITWVTSNAIPRPVPHKLQKFVDKTK